MLEKKKHLDAFEEYIALGDDRNFTKLSKRIDVSQLTIGKWAKEFNWQERANLRDIENARQIAKITDRSIVATKAKYRKDIEENMQILRDTIKSAIDPVSKKLGVKTKTPKDINSLVAAYEKLAKLDLLLVGENTDNETITIKVDIE